MPKATHDITVGTDATVHFDVVHIVLDKVLVGRAAPGLCLTAAANLNDHQGETCVDRLS